MMSHFGLSGLKRELSKAVGCFGVGVLALGMISPALAGGRPPRVLVRQVRDGKLEYLRHVEKMRREEARRFNVILELRKSVRVLSSEFPGVSVRESRVYGDWMAARENTARSIAEMAADFSGQRLATVLEIEQARAKLSGEWSGNLDYAYRDEAVRAHDQYLSILAKDRFMKEGLTARERSELASEFLQAPDRAKPAREIVQEYLMRLDVRSVRFLLTFRDEMEWFAAKLDVESMGLRVEDAIASVGGGYYLKIAGDPALYPVARQIEGVTAARVIY